MARMEDLTHGAHPEKYSYEATVKGDYPAVIHEPGQCAACDASAAFYARLGAEDDAWWRWEQHAAVTA